MGSDMSALPSKVSLIHPNPSSANSRDSAGSEAEASKGAKSGRNLSGSNNGDETHFSKNWRETSNLTKRGGFGVMRRVPHCALVHSYVLNNLEKGPARVADLVRRGQAEFGFSRCSNRIRGQTLRSRHAGKKGTNILAATHQFVCHLVGLRSSSLTCSSRADRDQRCASRTTQLV